MVVAKLKMKSLSLRILLDLNRTKAWKGRDRQGLSLKTGENFSKMKLGVALSSD